MPLVKKLTPKAEEVFEMLSKKFMVTFDETGTIGKRYRRQDEIGTPFCITYDFDTLEKDGCVTCLLYTSSRIIAELGGNVVAIHHERASEGSDINLSLIHI